ncbi:armadillo-like helical domain-containing protein 3 [Hyalella azteca]|uniref:Armadillo-like helical domain-containing protein 3 n=1 Tax=Hyalella azteca TaxID=294128 RepID=A0A8B7NTJ5_HYAAZ|nr:armadillo-like helical domain-containing protein 3 [Hyalella azteca]
MTTMSSMSSKLKGGGVRRGQLKEKVVQMYEELLHPAIHPSFSPSMGTPSLPNKSPASRFWEDFFLLRPKLSALEGEINRLSVEQLAALKPNLNGLFAECVGTLNNALQPSHTIRSINAMLTLCGLIRGVYRKCEGGGPTAVLPGSSPFSMSGSACDVINILVGFDAAEDLMRQLLLQVSEFLTGESPGCLKRVSLKLLLVLCTATDDINQNTLLEYLTITCVFHPVMQLLADSCSRHLYGGDAVMFILLMVQYRSHEMVNPYTVQLSLLDNELVLNGYGQVIRCWLSAFNRKFAATMVEAQSSGWLASITSMVGGLFVSDEHTNRTHQIKANDAYLLGLFEAVHLNRNFITALTTAATEASSPPSPSTSTQSLHSAPQNVLAETGTQGMTSSTHSSTSEAPIDSPSSPTTNTSVPCPNTAAISPSEGLSQQAAPQLITINNNTFNTSLAHDRQEENSSYEQQQLQLLLEANVQPTNLMVTFLEYCSIVMQDTKSEECHQNVQLCFIILTCISEDQYSNLLLHDANLVFAVQLHRLPMRHRKLASPHGTTNRARPLACAVIDLLVEFTMSHMLKKLPVEQFMQCVGIVHRLLCYQKRNAVRLPYAWKELWTALIALTKFIVANETQLVKRHNIFQLAYQIVNIFNLFITYGDTFLSSASCYDELYYEIMRMHIVFENLYSLGLRYARSDGDYKDQAHQLTNSLANIRSIIGHFSPALDRFSHEQNISTLTEAQVLDVVRSNYESLTLKLHDSLDTYTKYTALPHHKALHANMVRVS